jgi:hypothetical protein
MKTKVFYLATKVTVAVILVAILALEASASGNPKLTMVPYASERAIITLENGSNSISELTIENASGDVVYYSKGKITDEIYSKKFNLANLRDGDYKVSVTNKNGKNDVFFTVSNNKIAVKSNENLSTPFVEIKDDILKLSLLNSSLTNINMIVSNENGVVYKKSLGNNFSINAGFNLSKLESGDYAINITDGVKTYSYNFNK